LIGELAGRPRGRRDNPAAFLFVQARRECFTTGKFTELIRHRTRTGKDPRMFAYRWDDNDDELDSSAAVDWSAAACNDGGAGALTGLFFSDEIPDIELAKAICSSCALAAACLTGALDRREPAGVWGGQLFADGQVIAQKRKRGRPPKSAAVAAGPQVTEGAFPAALAPDQMVCIEATGTTVRLADFQEGRRRSA
jgi:WhiB family redox-sensing transcriptional regulator